MRINVSLTKKGSINKAIEELEKYKKSLQSKAERFVELLYAEGIKTALANGGKYGPYIVYEKEISSTDGEVTCLFIAADRHKIVSSWYTRTIKDGQGNAKVDPSSKRSYEVSPLLLAEFGSGFLAEVTDIYISAGDVGQGTMPNAYGHAKDPGGWFWLDENAIKHHSRGETPTFPVTKAFLSMQYSIERIARSVFNE